MAAPTGNVYWTLRETHGRPRKFTADQLWQAACSYFDWADRNPLNRSEVGPGSGIIQIPVTRPYSLRALALFIGTNTRYLRGLERSLEGDSSPEAEALRGAVCRMRDVIYEQQFCGAAVGIFNARIIARALGLANKKEQGQHVEEKLPAWIPSGREMSEISHHLAG